MTISSMKGDLSAEQAGEEVEGREVFKMSLKKDGVQFETGFARVGS